MTGPARRHLLRTAAAVLVLLAACGDDDVAGDRPGGGGPSTTTTSPTTTTTTTAPEPVEGLLATIAPNRLYATRHALGIGLGNVGSAPVEVAAVALESGLFQAAEVAEESVRLETTGRRFVLPVPYGEPVCDGAVDEHVVVVTLVDGRQLRVPAVEEFAGAVARLHERECRAAAVRERADLRFGDDWSQDGLAIHGTIELDERAPGEAVVVEDLRGNVIFTLTADGDPAPVLAIDDDRPAASVPVTISADRCDPHAVAEFKRPYVMLAWVAMGDAETAAVELEASGAARAALDRLIASCSTG